MAELISTPFINEATLSGTFTPPNGNPQTISGTSNQTRTDVVKVSLVKSVSQQNVSVGDTITYTIVVNNQSTIPINNVVVLDTDISPFLLISNILLNAVPVLPGQNLTTGIIIPTIPSLSQATIKFDAQVLINPPNIMPNIATATYLYQDGLLIGVGTAISNTVNIELILPQLEITKVANKNVVTVNGEQVLYTLTIRNLGNIALTNVIVTDVIPTGMTYVSNSTIIGLNPPVDDNPIDGINIGTLGIAGIQTVLFSVTVTI